MAAIAPESTDRDLLDHLRRVNSASVGDLEAFLGVTRTAVRQRLSRLMAKGVLERVVEKQPRGRPSYRYSLTPKGERMSGDNFGDLVDVLWDEVRQIEDIEVRRGLLKRLANRLAQGYASQLGQGALAEKMRALSQLMDQKELPFVVDESGGLPVLNALACPYPGLAETDRSVCAMERLMISEALGESVRLSECRLDGGTCCSFEPSSGYVDADADGTPVVAPSANAAVANPADAAKNKK
ncbi:MarR family protein [Posidoniimonas polymericola]|uniref:MarR family protein n=1 Tax=Posidoniimonas polymericola TaxID=2528002 RepID=A0A5C5YLN7_9BACT|nr:MarR family transcriptional regulator [Posidoniimonas polymericola]TWT75812.1 MarR family protein [Posidoniimonas polymericola]